MAYEPIKIELTPEDHETVETFCHGWKVKEMIEGSTTDMCTKFLQYLKGNGWHKEKPSG